MQSLLLKGTGRARGGGRTPPRSVRRMALALWLAIAGLSLPALSWAGNWGENWGTMIWGPQVVAVPGGPDGLSATLTVDGCDAVRSASFVAAPDTPSKPFGYDFPFGLLDFSLEGCTGQAQGITVTVEYSQPLPPGAAFFKEQGGVYAPYSAQLSGSTAVFYLTDNGLGDDDATAGVVHDPSGIGVPPDALPVPLLSPLMLWLLASLLAVLGWRRLGRVEAIGHGRPRN
jgi:hypothetical protein